MDTAPTAFPPLLLILGTDLAGKDHCANVVADAAESAGITVERRRELQWPSTDPLASNSSLIVSP